MPLLLPLGDKRCGKAKSRSRHRASFWKNDKRVEEYKRSVIGNRVREQHGNEPCEIAKNFRVLGPVVQRLDNAIHRINHYPVDSVVCFVNTYPLNSDLSDG